MKANTTLLLFAVGAMTIACGEMTDPSETSVVAVEETEEVEPEMTELEREHELYREGYADSVNQGLIQDNSFKGSARRIAEGKIDGVEVMVNYGSPGKRGRVLWNGLVSYDQVWVSGAHWATAVTFSSDVKVGDTAVPAGMYGFFTVPGRDEWTLILNKNFDQHLADEYDMADDVVRMRVKPEMLENPVERLTYMVEPAADGTGGLSMAWDQVKVTLPVASR